VSSADSWDLHALSFKDMHNGVATEELPVVFTGSRSECSEFAIARQYRWQPTDAKKYVFGGFWFLTAALSPNKESACLIGLPAAVGKTQAVEGVA
jgi:hypothetical protein